MQVQEWTHKLRKEGYQLDRQVRGEFKKGNIPRKIFQIEKMKLIYLISKNLNLYLYLLDLEVLILIYENLKDFRNILMTHNSL